MKRSAKTITISTVADLRGLLSKIQDGAYTDAEMSSLPRGHSPQWEALCSDRVGIWAWSSDGYAIVGTGGLRELEIAHFNDIQPPPCRGCGRRDQRRWELNPAMCFTCGANMAPQQITNLEQELHADRSLLAALEELARLTAGDLPQTVAEAVRIDRALGQVMAENYSEGATSAETSSSRRYRQAEWARAALKKLRAERKLF